jgi:methionyl-tRNA synthetase
MAPWKALKNDRQAAGATIATSINLIRIFSIAALPFIPATAATALEALGVDAASATWIDADIARELRSATPGTSIGDPGVLFKKVLPEDVHAWSKRFAGVETPRA